MWEIIMIGSCLLYVVAMLLHTWEVDWLIDYEVGKWGRICPAPDDWDHGSTFNFVMVNGKPVPLGNHYTNHYVKRKRP